MLRSLKGERELWRAARVVCLSKFCLSAICVSAVCLFADAAEGGTISLHTSISELSSPPVDAFFSTAIATRSTAVEDFNGFAAGQHLDSVALANFYMVIDASSVSLQAANETTLGRELPSAPLAASVLTGATIPWVEWRFDVPVASLDFVLLDQNGGGLFEITFADGSTPSTLPLFPSSLPYQWVGLLSDQSDMARVRFVPNQPGSYAFDDVRTSSVPEPAGAIVLLAAMVLLSAFSGRRNHVPE